MNILLILLAILYFTINIRIARWAKGWQKIVAYLFGAIILIGIVFYEFVFES